MMDERALYQRFHAALDIEPGPGAYDRLREALTRARPERRPWFNIGLPRNSRQLVAAAVVVVLAAAAVPAFLALHRYAQQVVTTRQHPKSTAPTCVPGLHMVTDTVGWRYAGSRTTDGGVTWRDVPPPELPNFAKGGAADCTLDADHAWTTQATAPPAREATQLYVFATADGGQTWQQSAPVPAGGGSTGASLEFIDAKRGWLFTQTGSDGSPPLTRTMYSTSDGGLHWNRVASGSEGGGSTLGKFAPGCAESGMTFVSNDKGWLTWDCSRSNRPSPTPSGGLVVAATNDGGHTWAPVRLPSFPATADWSCGASPPIFSGGQGVIPVSCGGVGHNGWAGVYRTSDGGDSWTLGQLPFWVQLSQVDFAEATTGFVFGGVATSDLYRSNNSGRDWVLVKRDVFLGQPVGIFQFIDAKTGYASTSASQGVLLKTTDGGLTWSLPGSSATIPQNPACGVLPNPRAGGPVPMKMVSPTTGWAFGALRTSDGGGRWSDVAPASVPYRSSGYAEFFLDANHAWVAQGAGSPTACVDHIVTFATADGGQTWRRAAPIAVTVDPAEVLWPLPTPFGSGSVARGPYLYFADAQHGWLLLVSGGIMSGHFGPLYRTTDGGLHWKVASIDPSSVAACPNSSGGLGGLGAGGMAFASASTGFVQGPHCEVGYTTSGPPSATYDPSKAPDQTPQQLVTHDGGVSWQVQRLAAATCCGVSLPVFFDQRNGILLNGSANTLLVTADGGDTWSPRTLPMGFDAVSFITPNEGWGIATDWQSRTYSRLFHTSDGGTTWTLMNARIAPAELGAARIEAGVFVASSLNFVDSRNGFWATRSKLYKTTDGGRNWVEVQARVG
jgi:photosystem II stability/assembly factor-like uncharacterized protein